MCLQKVKVKDLGCYRSPRFSYYNCGRCAACKQQIANSKVQKIQSHQISGFVQYFVTLTYDNEHVPVCSKADFKYAGSAYCDYVMGHLDDVSVFNYVPEENSYLLPVYRGTTKKIITTVLIKDPYSYLNCDELSGIVLHRDKTDSSKNVYHDDLFSICFSYDIKCFLKRLRKNLWLDNGENVPIYYFYSPEYGPDSFRFHAHFIFWFPVQFSEYDVKEYILKSWPYCDPHMLRKNINVARCAAHYVASYINCDSATPQLLLDLFPLRQSHSLGFGFQDDKFSLKSVLDAFNQSTPDYGFDVQCVDKDGNVGVKHFLYSKSLINRYFPKFKGFGRFSESSIKKALIHPELFFQFDKVCLWDAFDGKFIYDFFDCFSHTSDSGNDYYFIRPKDIKGLSISYTSKELQYTIKRINRCYERFQVLGYNRYDFADIVYRYIFGRTRYLQFSLSTDPIYSGKNQIYLFDNIKDIPISSLPTLEDFILDVSSDELDPSKNLFNLALNQKFLDQYYSNIKQRKLNCL